MPLVSVTMTSYNHERFISESIESVLAQDFDDFELVIIDDASIDASAQIIQKYEVEDPRIHATFHETNSGYAKTRNDCIEASKGKFIAHIDSDDVWAKDKLTKQLEVAAYNDDLVVWSEGGIIGEKGEALEENFTQQHMATSRKKSGDIFEELLRWNYILGSTLFYKRSNLGAIRYDESLLIASDHKFVLELARNYDFYYIAEPLAKYRIHGSNTIVGSSSEVRERQRIYAMERVLVYDEMLRQKNRAISNNTKATMYAQMSWAHALFGNSNKALRFYLQAISCNPYSWSILTSGSSFLKSMLKLKVRE